MMGTPYETDIVAWAGEQAALFRAGMLTAIAAAAHETGLDISDGQRWPAGQVLDLDFLPG
jgi:hypothetical protein